MEACQESEGWKRHTAEQAHLISEKRSSERFILKTSSELIGMISTTSTASRSPSDGKQNQSTVGYYHCVRFVVWFKMNYLFYCETMTFENSRFLFIDFCGFSSHVYTLGFDSQHYPP